MRKAVASAVSRKPFTTHPFFTTPGGSEGNLLIHKYIVVYHRVHLKKKNTYLLLDENILAGSNQHPTCKSDAIVFKDIFEQW